MKQYIAVIGLYNEITTEQISLKEISINAIDMYQAHKEALFKCSAPDGQVVLRIFEVPGKFIKYDLLKGFFT